MKIGIIGAGEMGQGLAGLLSRAGHAVLLSSRNPAEAARSLPFTDRDVRVASVFEAASAPVVFLALPFDQAMSVFDIVGSFEGQIVVDLTAAPSWTYRGQAAGLQIARRIPQACVVKAFSHIAAEALEPGLQHRDGLPLAAYYCGNHEPSNRVVAELISDTGFAPVCIGSLAVAHAIERDGILERLGLRLATQARELVEIHLTSPSPARSISRHSRAA